MFVVCEICDCSISSAREYDLHMGGRKHQRQLEVYKNRKEQSERCIFVKGFPPRTSETELMSYFSAFGTIAKVVYDEKRSLQKKTPPFAIIEFYISQSAQIALNYGSHILNSQKLDVRPRTFKELATEPYYPWQRHQMNSNLPWNVEAVQQQPLQAIPQLQQQKIGRPKDSEGEESLPLSVDALQKHLQEANCVGIQTQMMMMMELVQVPATELQQRYHICKVIEDALKPFFPGVTVNQFGSSVNGFGVKGCDMDIYLDLSRLGIPCRTGSIQLPFTRDIHTLKKNKGPLGQQDVDKMTNLDKLKLISRILVEHAPSCNETQIIPSQRCPLVRFTHTTGIKCDLSINNKLALQNTRLLQTLSLYDSRIRPLVYAIRYWGKLKSVAGNPKAGPKLSNYALTMLVLYYLMNTEPHILPSIETLASLCGHDRTIIEQWDCSFISAQFMPPTANVQTAEELLFGFFKFYAHFDFRNTAISIRTGKPMDLNAEQLQKVIKVGSMNIQDPFVLDHNITLNVNEKLLVKFIREIRIAEGKAINWSDVAFAETKSLMDIFSDEVPKNVDLLSVVKQKAATSQSTDFPLGEYQFIFEYNQSKYSPAVLQQFEEAGNAQLGWCQQAVQFIYAMIERILMFDCEVRDKSMVGYLRPSRTYSLYRRDADQKTESWKKRPAMDKNLSEPDAKKSRTQGETSDRQSQGAGDSTKNNDVLATEGDTQKTTESCRKGDRGGVTQETTEGGDQQESSATSGDHFEPIEMEIEEEHDPTEDEYDFGDSEVYIDMDVKVMCRIWAIRKKIGQELKSHGFEDGIDFEKKISERLFYDVYGPSRRPVLEFRCVIRSLVNFQKASILVDCIPKPNQKEFYGVYNFMKKILIKMAEKHFKQ